MNQQKKSLVRRLTVTFFLLSLLGVSIMSLAVYTLARNTIQGEVIERLRIASALKKTELEHWVQDQKISFFTLARAPALRERAAILLTRPTDHPYYAPAFRELAEVLASLVKNTPEFLEILVIDGSDGQVLLSTKPEHIGHFRVDEIDLRRGMEGAYVNYSKSTAANSEQTISVTTPLLNEKGERQGVLVAYLVLNRLHQIISADTSIGTTSETFLLDRQNVLLPTSPGEFSNSSGQAVNPPIEMPPGQTGGMVSYRDDSGDPVVGYFHWLTEPRIALLTIINEEEGFQHAKRLGLVMAVIGLAVSALLGGCILVFARRIARPITAITNASLQVAAGDFGIQVPIKTDDELGVLGDSFNRMVAQLHHLYQESAASTERFRSVFQLSPDAIAVQDARIGTFIEINKSFCSMFAYSEDEVLGHSAAELSIFDSRREHLRLVAQLNRTGHVSGMKSLFRKSNGELFHGIITSRLIDLQGLPASVSVLWDISEQRNTEEALKRSQAFLRSIINHMDNGILALDEKRRVVYFNEKYLELYPFERDFVEGQPFIEDLISKACEMGIYPNEDRIDLINERLSQLDEAYGLINIQTPRTDGIILEGYATRLPGWGYLIFFRDITARRRAEVSLQQSEKQFRDIFRTSPNPVLIERLDGGGIVDVNPAFVNLTGFPPETCQGCNTLDLGLWQDEMQCRQFFLMLQADDEVHNLECDFLRRDGTSWFALLSARTVLIQEQECAVIACRDITREKEIENTLREMDRLKSDFISTAAHELNTPLSIIMGYTEFLIDPSAHGGFTAEQKQEFLVEIYEKGETLSRLVDDLLDISRIESGIKITLNIEPHNPAEALGKVVKRFQIHYSTYTFQLKLEGPQPETVDFDLPRVVQVLENFMTNSVKYSPPHSTIVLQGTLQQGFYQIIVEDHGIGMTSEQKNRVFDKFYRADTSDTAIGGLGLGMSIAKQIVEMHGGGIWVETALGEGTKVYFTLPLTQAPQMPQPPG